MKRNKVLHIVLNPVFAAIFLFVLFVVTAFHLYIVYDESLWMYIGNLWNNKGIPPYVGAVENKTPGIFILFAISDYLTSGNVFFVRGLGVVATMFTALFLYGICAKIYNKTAAVISLYVFGFITCWQLMDGFAFAHTEVFMILFSTMSFYALMQSQFSKKNIIWLFLVGLSMGIAITFKQIAITTAFALLVVFLVLNKEKPFLYLLNRVLIIVFGISFSTFLSFLVLYFYGVSFYDYLEGAWLILFNSGSKVTNISEHFTNFINALVFSRLVFFYPIIIWFLWKKNFLNHSHKMLLILWLLFDFVGVNASGYYYGHQLKQMLPAFSIIMAISISFLIGKRYNDNTNGFYTVAAQIVLLIGIVCFPYKQIYQNFKLITQYDNTSLTPHVEIANWIKENSTSEDYIYIIGGEPNLIRTQAIVNRTSASKYFQSLFLTSDYERGILMEDLKQNLPVFILRDQFIDENILKKYGNKFKTFVDENYVLVKTMYNVEILKQL
tara:strand:+ start:30095 stop:31582 length:1488 start_codon:yes stop_codon:yes gene_type:complete